MKGPKGELSFNFTDHVLVELRGQASRSRRGTSSGPLARLGGMLRTMIANLMKGVTEGFSKKLEINGVGYRAAVQGRKPAAGARLRQARRDLSDPWPASRSECAKPTEILVSGTNRRQVGQVGAEIRDFRCPEPYKGKA